MYGFFKHQMATKVELQIQTNKKGDIYIEKIITINNGFYSLVIKDTKGDVELQTFKPINKR